MGTRAPKVMLLLLVVGFTLSMVAWAEGALAPPPEQTNVDDSQAAVYFYDDRTFESWITVGAGEGLRPCAQVAFYRDGVEVARGTVVKVRPSDAVVATGQNGPQGPIVHRGDIVRVCQNGTRADVKAAVAKEQAWQTFLDYSMTGLLTILILIGG
jgi:hypothetical protein